MSVTPGGKEQPPAEGTGDSWSRDPYNKPLPEAGSEAGAMLADPQRRCSYIGTSAPLLLQLALFGTS